MQSSAFRFVSVFVTFLLAAGLAGLIWLTLRNQPAVTIQPLPTATPTTVPTPTATPFETLGADLISPEGGYRFQPLTGYDVTFQGAAVTLSRVLTETGAATIALDVLPLTVAGLRADQPLEELLAQLAQPFVERAAAELSEIEPVRIGAADGVAIAWRGTLEGEAAAGRIAIAQRDAATLFVAAATAPTDLWENEIDAAMRRVLAGVTFFEPVSSSAAPPAANQPDSSQSITPVAARTPGTLPTVAVISAQSPTNADGAETASLPLMTPTPEIFSRLTPTPTPTSLNFRQPWTVVSDANDMNALVASGNTLWIATEGGALAWTRGSASPVKFTSINGLTGNQLTAVTACDLPNLGLIFGSNDGLQIINPLVGGWRQLNSSNSDLRYDDVSALACDADAGYLVVGYARHGIDVFNARTNTWRHLDRNSGLASNNVRALAVVGALDEIWVVSDDGVTVSAGQDSTFYSNSNSPLESNRVGAIAADPTGGVWLGGDGVLYRVADEEWTVFSAEEVGDDGFPLRMIVGLAPTDTGDLWLIDIDGALCRFDPGTTACVEAYSGGEGMAAAPVTHLALDNDGRLYYTTAGDGFSVYDGATWQHFVKANEGVVGNTVTAATVDTAGALWVATNIGIQRIVAPTRPPVMLTASGVEPGSIQAIHAARNGDFWVGGVGAALWNGVTWRQFTAEDGLIGAAVQAIAEDSRGRVWLGTDDGVSIWNGATFVNLTSATGLPNSDIRALRADGDAMWIGSAGGGLYRFVRNQLEVFTTDNIGLPGDTVTALAVDQDGLLFVGTDAGLAELRDGVALPIPAVGERAITQILAVNGSVWVGTDDSGLFYDLGEGWRQETSAGALPDNHITALCAVDDGVWVGGASGGLVRYTLPTKE